MQQFYSTQSLWKEKDESVWITGSEGWSLNSALTDSLFVHHEDNIGEKDIINKWQS